MNTVNSSKNLILAAALALGLASVAFAQDANVAAPKPTDSSSAGLLGQNFATLGYSTSDLDGTSVSVSRYSILGNENVREGVDTTFEYGYSRSSSIAGSRFTQHDILVGGRVYTSLTNIKPYAEGGIGWVWSRGGGSSDSSFAWSAGVGAELKVAPMAAVTPYLRYEDIADGSGSEALTYGVKGNYWVNDRVALSAGVERNDGDNYTTFTFGASYRY